MWIPFLSAVYISHNAGMSWLFDVHLAWNFVRLILLWKMHMHKSAYHSESDYLTENEYSCQIILNSENYSNIVNSSRQAKKKKTSVTFCFLSYEQVSFENHLYQKEKNLTSGSQKTL